MPSFYIPYAMKTLLPVLNQSEMIERPDRHQHFFTPKKIHIAPKLLAF